MGGFRTPRPRGWAYGTSAGRKQNTDNFHTLFLYRAFPPGEKKILHENTTWLGHTFISQVKTSYAQIAIDKVLPIILIKDLSLIIIWF